MWINHVNKSKQQVLYVDNLWNMGITLSTISTNKTLVENCPLFINKISQAFQQDINCFVVCFLGYL